MDLPTVLRRAFSPHFALASPNTPVLFALLARFALLGVSLRYMDFQRHHYHSQGLEALLLAHAVVTGHGFAFPYPNFIATAWVAPVYVWILSLGVLLFPAGGQGVVLFGQILNILFSAFTCYPIYLLGKRVFRAKLGLAAAWVWAFLPVAVLMPIAFTWDQSLAALTLTVLLVLTWDVAKSSSRRLWSGYGLLWGFAALTNPTLFVLFPFLILWTYLMRRKFSLPALSLIARATLFCVLALLPWTLRNWKQLGGFTFVKSNFGVEFWLGNNPEVKDIFSPMRHPFINSAELDQLVAMGELNYNRAKEKEALSFISSHPATFARLFLHRFVDTWTAFYDSKTDLYIKPLGVRPLYILFSSLFSMAAFCGWIVACRKHFLERLPLTICIAVFPLPYYLTHTSQRYRHPIDPIVTILAVIGTWWVIARLKRQANSTSVPAEENNPEAVLSLSLGT